MAEDCLELHVNVALCVCVSATRVCACMCECPPIAGFGWCSEPGSSVSPSSKVSSSSPEKQDIYTKMPVIVPHTHTVKQTHTQSHSVFTLTEQSGALASEECLSQSVPSRCVSIDNCCVKYYNKQNSKMVLACQQLPYFNHVCRLLAEMENFPLKQKGTLLSECNLTQQLQSEPQSLCNKSCLQSEDLTDVSNLPH